PRGPRGHRTRGARRRGERARSTARRRIHDRRGACRAAGRRRRRPRPQAAIRLHAAARRRLGAPGLATALRVDGDSRQGLDARAAAFAARALVTTGPVSGPGGAPRQLDGVLLDVDDTLVDTRGAFTNAWRTLLGEYLPHLEASELEQVVRVWREDAGGHYAAYAAGRLAYDEQRLRRVNALHAHFGGPELDDGGFATWNEAFESGFRAGWLAFDDALAAVDALRVAGVAVGVVTNAAADYQALKLARAGFDGLPVLVGVDTFGFGKPDSRVFHAGAQRLGVDPARTAYVGDELHADAIGAHRAGLLGVWLDRRGTRRHVLPEGDIPGAPGSGAGRRPARA